MQRFVVVWSPEPRSSRPASARRLRSRRAPRCGPRSSCRGCRMAQNGRHRYAGSEAKQRSKVNHRVFDADSRCCSLRQTGHLLLLIVLMVLLCAMQVGRHMFELTHAGRDLRGSYQDAPPVAATAQATTAGKSRLPAPLSWQEAMQMMRESSRKYVVVDVKNGLGNRLRAMASARSVASVLGRPVLLVWQPDLHCNCSYQNMFEPSDSMVTLLEEEIPQVSPLFQLPKVPRRSPRCCASSRCRSWVF